MRQVRGCGLVVAAIAVLFLAGCATLGAPRPTNPEDPNALAVVSAGDVGALGCLLIVTEGSPDDVASAKVAVAAAKTVLSDPVPSFAVLSAALSQAMPPKYAIYSTIILQRVKARLGDADLIPADTVGWALAEAFLESCGAALGAVQDA